MGLGKAAIQIREGGDGFEYFFLDLPFTGGSTSLL
jgi:hypothetical protein